MWGESVTLNCAETDGSRQGEESRTFEFHLTIPPLFKKSNKKRKVTTKKQIDPTVNSARLALNKMGFTLTEATSLIDKVYHEQISVAELIKGCLKNVEPAKTN